VPTPATGITARMSDVTPGNSLDSRVAA
jgi:hypothetical protein